MNSNAMAGVNKEIVLETEMLTDPIRGHYTKTIWYSDGTKEEIIVPKGKIITPIPLDWL